jgi:hypothetical protein
MYQLFVMHLQQFYVFLLKHTFPVACPSSTYFKFYTGCFKKSFTTLTAYISIFSGQVQCFELS